MSRVGKAPIDIPQGVECHLTEGVVKTKGKLGELQLTIPSLIEIQIENNKISIFPKEKSKEARQLWGTIRARLFNMVQGVHEGFTRLLEINGVGYRAALQGKDLVLNLGYSHDVRYLVPEGITIKCPKPTEVSIFGADKQKVGKVASDIKAYRPPEPYKGKGIKYANERILRKEGKKK